MTATVTSDFKHEFEAESARRLRKRFLWYSGVALLLGLLGVVSVVVMLVFAPSSVRVQAWVISAASILSMVPYIWAFVYAWRNRSIKRGLLIKIVFWLLVGTGLLNLMLAPFSKVVSEAIADDQRTKIREARAAAEEAKEASALTAIELEAEDAEATKTVDADVSEIEQAELEDPDVTTASGKVIVGERQLPGGGKAQFTVGQSSMGIGFMWMFNLFIAHFFAALFIPWTPREAIAPLVPLLAVNAVGAIGLKLLGGDDTWITIAVIILLSPLVGMPGTLICWWRHSRYRQKFHYKMLRGRYGEIKQELSDAQRIHEALFPKPIADGQVRMDYVYEPMRQIGGDYFFTRATDREDGSHVFDLVLIDVTGHGLTAALTVNRLAGELQREFGENPEITPAQILTGLNNYVHHTLALHSVYATALALRIDTSTHRVSWASAGHPPAFLRGVDGTIERLESTALVLGACLGDDFIVDEESHAFGPGDTVVVYTDGATEARNSEGKMLTVRGLEAIIANDRPDEHGGWSATVMRHVEAHREGPAEDDTLLVEVYRPVTV